MFSELWKIRTTYKNISRISQVVNVLIKHGFGQFIEQLGLHRLIPFRKRLKIMADREIIETTMPERLRMVFEELGPSFIKLAQILSYRPDLITEKYAGEFAKLQDEVPPFPYAELKVIIEKELHQPVEDIFLKIDEKAVAAASISQVHKAVLKDGSKVVVKVQRPKIREIIETDINIMRALSALMLKYIPESEIFNPSGIVDEFSRTIKKELNFVDESKNILRFAKNFRDDDTIKIPEVYTQYISDKVIVMERIQGIRINDFEGMAHYGIDRSAVAATLVNAYFKMILDHGFFHADPHPGNLFVLPDGRLAIIDFGMASWITPDAMESIAGVLIAIVNKDFDALIDQFVVLGMVSDEVDIDKFRQAFMADMMDLLLPLYDTALSEINFAEYLDTITKLSMKHSLRVPSSMILIDKCMLIIDRTVRELDPKFNIISSAAPYTTTVIRKKYGPKRILDKVERNLSEIGDSLIDTPKKMRVLLRKLINGDFTMKINPMGIERVIRDIDKSTNRLSFSIVISSIILSSSILAVSGVGAKVLGIPAIGTLGFMIAFFLGIWLIISILRSGRL